MNDRKKEKPIEKTNEKPKDLGLTNLSAVAGIYGVSRATMRKLLKPYWKRLGARIGNIITTRQLSLIFKFLGPPKIRYPFA